MIPFNGQRYFDDRIYTLEVARVIRTTGVSAAPRPGDGVRWCVITRRNVPGYPPTRSDEFDTRAAAISYLESVEPEVPRISLNGASPRPTPTLDAHREWLERENLKPSWIEPEPPVSDVVFPVYSGRDLVRMIEAERTADLGFSFYQHRINVPAGAVAALRWRIEPQFTPHRLFDHLETRAASRDLVFPWLLVVLDRPYRFRGHMQACFSGEQAVQWHSHVADANPVSPELPSSTVSILEIDEREDLERLAGRSPVLGLLVRLASSLDPSRRWLLLPAPLGEAWVAQLEEQDRELFARQMR